MKTKLLTEIVVQLVNERAKNGYGVSIINLPSFDYSTFALNTQSDHEIEFFFLGFYPEDEEILKASLPVLSNKKYFFTVEEAELSRNTGKEDVFRVLIIKRTEIEKLSSLMWFDEINLSQVYNRSCNHVKKSLAQSNEVIDTLISALGRQDIREILNFERVLEYLEDLLAASPDALPVVIQNSYYKLGLCKDSQLVNGDHSCNTFREKIKHNRDIVDRIGGMDQAERQSVNNFYSKHPNSKITKQILSFYKNRDILLLKDMELEAVEECLKNVKQSPDAKEKSKKTAVSSPTAVATKLIFDGAPEQIKEVLDQINDKFKDREESKKPGKLDIDINGTKVQILTDPTTEKIAEEMIDSNDFGGVIFADVSNPKEAIESIDKYSFMAFNKEYLDKIFDSLNKVKEITHSQEILNALEGLISSREKVVCFKERLQDAPMLQVLQEKDRFFAYLNAYSKLLTAITEEFPVIWGIAPSRAKEIISSIISLDMVYVVGEDCHALPSSLNPLYLWKYIKLAEELLDTNGVDSSEYCHLSEDDKAFITRKADDIPDPLTVLILPASFKEDGAVYLPLVGRAGCVPIYSTKQQINQSYSGIDTLKQAIVRYMCLYPHSSMMLRLCFVNPPSIEMIASMLKKLNNDRESMISGIDVTIYRTKEVPNDWVEIEDNSLNEGMLGRVKGKSNLQFKLSILNETVGYQEIINRLAINQHILIIFDPNEVKLDIAKNNRQIHIHPLCVPKIYEYDPLDEKIEIRAANEGSIFSDYASILEKLNEHPSSFSHTSTFFNTPLKKETYNQLLEKTDWLIMLDQNLRSWDISLRSASEKIYYKENESRSIGIYSKNCKKFILGYNKLISCLGNFIPQEIGVKSVIQAIRETNDDGLLSIVSHSSNAIFDDNHGKGSLGLAIAALCYKSSYGDAILVGLDTQLAREWLADRDDGKIPDLIGVRVIDEDNVTIDIVEVKTYDDYKIEEDKFISGHAVDQASVLEHLIIEIFGKNEKITTVSRKEILREQVFEALYQADLKPKAKHKYTQLFNNLFAGDYHVKVNKSIFRVKFGDQESKAEEFSGKGEHQEQKYSLITIGSNEIQAILSGINISRQLIVEHDDVQSTEMGDSTFHFSEPENSTTEQAQADELGLTLQDALDSSITSEQSIMDDISNKESEFRAVALEKCFKLNKIFKNFGLNVQPVKVEMIQQAARFIRFKLELCSGESIKNIEKHKMDIGIELEAFGELLISHIKGTKFIALDVPFEGLGKPLPLLDSLTLLNKHGALDVLAGQAPDGKIKTIDIAEAPHLLIAGTTGSGKTVFLFSLILSLINQYNENDLELLIIDPKQTDFIFFNDLPHLRNGKVVTNAVEALQALETLNTVDKEVRTKLLVDSKCKDIYSYNNKNPETRMKRLVVVIDEYADLVQTAEMEGIRKEFEASLCMLAQRVRNLGIHLVIATQRPNAAIVTSALKTNIPFRISFRLPAHQDSLTILDRSGAEDLLGKGDMLVVTDSDILRLQGFYISEDELEKYIASYPGSME